MHCCFRPRRITRIRADCAAFLLASLLFLCLAGTAAQAQTAARLPQFLGQIQLGDVFPGADKLGSVEGTPPAAPAYKGDKPVGYVYLNSDVVSSNGYSGKPIDIVIGIDLSGQITGAKLVEHHEPIVLVGIPVAKIEKLIGGFVGKNFLQTPPSAKTAPDVDIVSGATVTTMVIADTIARSAIRIARARGLGGAKAEAAAAPEAARTVDETKGTVETWEQLLDDGSLRRLTLTLEDVDEAYEKAGQKEAAKHEEEAESEEDADDRTFIDLYVGLASAPAIGRSLLGDDGYQRLKASLQPGQQAIVVAGNGRYSFKGSGYVRGGIFDRIELVQGDDIYRFHDRDHHRLGDISAAGAPRFREIGLFTMPQNQRLDPAEPFTLKLLVQRVSEGREKAFLTFELNYQLPDKYMAAAKPAAAAAPAGAPAAAGAIPAEPEAEPLWIRVWKSKVTQISILALAIMTLTGIFFFQDFLVRRPVLYDRVRLGFLAFTLFWIGWYAQAQLSVVNVLTFANALRTDFRWDYFLVDPLIFMLWFAVAAALLFWGRGAYCGWLCPFGALQELMNRGAKALKIPQIKVPFGLHQRLWPIKYMIFMVLFGLALYSLSLGEKASEVEPFKTAIVLHFMRDWPFVLYAAVLLGAGLFIERFFCRYLCPLGAALAIPARMRMFDWLRRYRECGNPCQRCANECPVQSIHPEGHINPNECIQCMHCQMLYHHDHKCPVMIQRRLKAEKRLAVISPGMRPEGGESASTQISRLVHGTPKQGPA
jgi:NosR/NirI family nitrous oxide reductase transcriptional regulator